MKERALTRKEELILLSILNLQEGAYLIAIQKYLTTKTAKKVSLTSVYIPLNRLEQEGFIESEWGKATEVRGGRRKKIYRPTKAGMESLYLYRELSETLWEEYQKITT